MKLYKKAMSSNNILIRADSSSTIGTGHIMRDLVLAKRYLKDTILFATQDLEGNINHKITEFGYSITILKSNNIKELDILIKKQKINMIIIDHYGLNHNFEKQLKTLNPTLTIFCLDDTYTRHYCDILLNHNIYANPEKYKNLVPKNCELLCGSKYTLLRDEFLQTKIQYERNSYFNIFIAIGGADTANLNIPILNTLVLLKNKNIRVNIVTTIANKYLQQLIHFCKNKKWINLHINSNSLAKILIKSDLAIVTPSVTVNEVYFMQVPLIAIKVASNQEYMYRFLKQKRFFTLDKFNRNKLLHYIKRCI